jgi:plastocyanin
MHPSTFTARRAALMAATVAFLVSGLAACGSDDSSDTAGGTTTESASDGEYGSTDGDTAEGTDGTIVAEDFSLTDITVAPGAEIVLQNDGAATHTATADDGSFDLGEVAGGETSDPGTAPTTPGEYPFHCEIHDSMTATLTVEG